MRKFILRFVLLACFGGIASAQIVQDLAPNAPVNPVQWRKAFEGGAGITVRSVQGTSDGGVILTGKIHPVSGQPSDLLIAKLEPGGELLWRKFVGGGGQDQGYAVKEMPNGDFVVVGAVGTPNIPWVLRLNSQGTVLWTRHIGNGTGSEFLYDFAYVASDGGIILVGEKDSDVWLVRLADDGGTQWSKTYGTTHVERGRAICEDTQNGGFIVAGTSFDHDSLGNVLVFHVDLAGNIGWQSEFAGNNFGLGNQADQAYAVSRLAQDRGFVVAADTRRPTEGLSSDVVIKFDFAGTSSWRAFLGSHNEMGTDGISIAGAADGGYFLGAQSRATSPSIAWLVKGGESGDVEPGCGDVQVVSTSYGPGAIDLTPTNISVSNTLNSYSAKPSQGINPNFAVTVGSLCEGASAWSRSYSSSGTLGRAVQAVDETLDGGVVFAQSFTGGTAFFITKLAPSRTILPEQVIYGGDSLDKLGLNQGIVTGDFDKDTVPDLLLGAGGADGPNNSRADAGEAYVVLRQKLQHDLDVGRTSDAFARFRGASAGDALGSAIAAGDLNDDGFADMILGAPGRDTGGGTDSGEVDVFFASSTLAADIDLASVSPDVRITGSVAGGAVGSSFALGKLNDDAYADLVIGAPGDIASPGRVYVFYGPIAPGTYSTSAANVTVVGRDNGDALGTRVAVGNVNGTEAMQDLAVSAPKADGIGNLKSNAGEIYVLFAPLQASYTLSTTPPSYEVIGADADDELGYGLAVGDVGNDENADIAISARFGDGNSNGRANAGEVYVKYGNTSLAGTLDLVSSSADVRLIGGRAGDNLGTGLAIADVNHQAPLDLIVGAPRADGPGSGPTGPRTDTGEVDVLLGPLGQPTVDLSVVRPSLAFHGVDVSDGFGAVVAGGDVTGDGMGDLLVAASGGDGPNGARSSAAEVYLINGYCTPETAQCKSVGNSCTTFHLEMDSSCGINCDACSSIATTAALFSGGGAEGAYCAAGVGGCDGSGTCDGDTDEDGLVEGQYVFGNACFDGIAGGGFEMLLTGGPQCPNRKLLLRFSGVQQEGCQ